MLFLFDQLEKKQTMSSWWSWFTGASVWAELSQPSLVAIVGDPQLGKSTLAAKLVQEIRKTSQGKAGNMFVFEKAAASFWNWQGAEVHTVSEVKEYSRVPTGSVVILEHPDQ